MSAAGSSAISGASRWLAPWAPWAPSVAASASANGRRTRICVLRFEWSGAPHPAKRRLLLPVRRRAGAGSPGRPTEPRRLRLRTHGAQALVPARRPRMGAPGEHDVWLESAALAALGALDREARARFAAHLRSGCSLCLAELREAERTCAALAALARPAPVPAALRERVLASCARPDPPLEAPPLLRGSR